MIISTVQPTKPALKPAAQVTLSSLPRK